MSSTESDFNYDYGVSAQAEATDEPATPLLEANELVLLKLLNEQPDGISIRWFMRRIAT